jgi:hypothetical protein
MTDGESGRLEPAGQLPEVIAAAGPRGRGQPDQLPVRRLGSPAEIPGQAVENGGGMSLLADTLG